MLISSCQFDAVGAVLCTSV